MRKVIALLTLVWFCWLVSTHMLWLIASGIAMPVVLVLAIVLAS
jgi:hypothetical protein